MEEVTIVDYGAGNIANVMKALKAVGLSGRLSDQADEIAQAKALIIPGVGAFNKAMQALNSKNLVQPIRDFADSGRPVLGICLGMQLLFDESSEFGHTQGLGLVPGKVIELPAQPGYRVPQMGWNDNQVQQENPLTQDLKDEATYFVHSYYARTQPENLAASVQFGQVEVPSVVVNKNVFGTQFHPEKSGSIGLQLLKNFKKMVNAYDPSSN
ncbi:imidazole glycerol phosphate synthase subunit HisH [Eupransor demetentiae]|uniref:Imidazole glycerol phosphate synthase subunit HisH n=1 Tax=Eupransor demetentiae TaxID=3109584 RepID=A0ABM9N384_9LACO|nr:Imidazoleglycerol phosphate synthase glutamine amidotransferase subunit HisH (HisH) [Lactobacillaceae bacterium LMG 33000]